MNKFPVLRKIEVLTKNPVFRKVSRKHWELLSFYHARFHTDEGIYDLYLSPGWITDFRSGSNAINLFVPKRGNEQYNACIYAHDASWSGHLSRALSNDLFIRQGFHVSGQVFNWRASVAGKAVDNFGTYYGMDDKLPEPYTINRCFERITLSHR